MGRLISLVFVDGFSIFQRCWKAVDEENWLERFSRLAPLALKSAFRSLRSIRYIHNVHIHMVPVQILAYNVNRRHQLLLDTIGPLPEEIDAYWKINFMAYYMVIIFIGAAFSRRAKRALKTAPTNSPHPQLSNGVEKTKIPS